MPKLKQSMGKIKFVTPFSEELQRYLNYELFNAEQFNPKAIKSHAYGQMGDLGQIGDRRWKFYTTTWCIEWNGKDIICTSDDPKIWIRQGLEINMGRGELVIGYTAV